MLDIWTAAGVVLAGALLGLFFFAGLWWTTRRGLVSPRPVLWFVGSVLVRVALTLAGLLAVCGDQWQRWLLCLLGFWAARVVVLRWTGTRARAMPGAEVTDAP